MPLQNQNPLSSVIKLDPMYYPEAIRETLTPKYYLGAAILNYEVTTNAAGNLIWKHSNQLVDDDQYLFVLTLDFKLYMAPKDSMVRSHAWLSNGNPLRGVGNLTVIHNKIDTVDNDSGHYKPTKEALLETGEFDFFYNLAKETMIKFIDYSKTKYGFITTYELEKDPKDNHTLLKKMDEKQPDEDFYRFVGSPKPLRNFINACKKGNFNNDDFMDRVGIFFAAPEFKKQILNEQKKSNCQNDYTELCPALVRF